jgi:hypothetical protein
MAADGGRIYSCRFGQEELSEGLGKMEGVVRKVLAEGIEEGQPEMAGIDRRREFNSA